ncbi:MAG: hypothetical protein KC657_28665 [Myxococcales bacterium]|nr:hypothetical protein [Myxococcales bacterium]
MARARTILAISVLLAACGGSSERSPFEDGSSSGASGSSSSGGSSSGFGGSSSGGIDAGATDECRKMDIVFVVDNSGSMSQEQDNLAANFPKFITTLDGFRTKSGEPLDYRVAVTNTDASKSSDTGKFRTSGTSCSAGPGRPWLEKADGDIGPFFSCRAKMGTSGSATEQGLEAMKHAVTSRVTDGSNSDGGKAFLRDDALMAFLILTDEDETNSNSIDGYVQAFDNVKGDRSRWAAAAIAGETSCNSTFGSAREAKRLKEFIGKVGANGIFSSICAGDLTEGLTKALNTFQGACRNFVPVK